jgi:hypothetical protein
MSALSDNVNTGSCWIRWLGTLTTAKDGIVPAYFISIVNEVRDTSLTSPLT